MITTSQLSEELRRILKHPTGGIVGLVDELFLLCGHHVVELSWDLSQCRVRVAGGEWEEIPDLRPRKSILRAILGRIAAICNERVPGSISPYGGRTELDLGTEPAVRFRVSIINTSAEQRLELVPETGHFANYAAAVSDEQKPETATTNPADKALLGKKICPFCGHRSDPDTTVCAHCSMEDNRHSRSATRQRLGPWYVLQTRNPAAPGMNFDTLLALIRKRRVTAHSVVRGPTTNQFWTAAAKVRGISREFQVCWNCEAPVENDMHICPACKKIQEPPSNPNILLEDSDPSGQ